MSRTWVALFALCGGGALASTVHLFVSDAKDAGCMPKAAPEEVQYLIDSSAAAEAVGRYLAGTTNPGLYDAALVNAGLRFCGDAERRRVFGAILDALSRPKPPKAAFELIANYATQGAMLNLIEERDAAKSVAAATRAHLHRARAEILARTIRVQHPKAEIHLLSVCPFSTSTNAYGLLYRNRPDGQLGAGDLGAVVIVAGPEQVRLTEVSPRLDVPGVGFANSIFDDLLVDGKVSEVAAVRCADPTTDHEVQESLGKFLVPRAARPLLCFQADLHYNSWVCYGPDQDERAAKLSFVQMMSD